MKNAIILHGKPGKKEYYDPKAPSMSNAHWIPWLQGQLLKHDIEAATPEVPYSFDPRWELWVKETERFEITPETLLIGHSAGSGFWVRYLSEHPELTVDKLVLVAPSLGMGWDSKDFLKFEIDPGLGARVNKLIMFFADNDNASILEAKDVISAALPETEVREFKGYGHFTIDSMKTTEFPELLEELLK